VPESAEILVLVERGYLRVIDIAPILGVSHERVARSSPSVTTPQSQQG
jgi:hypothetical protein